MHLPRRIGAADRAERRVSLVAGAVIIVVLAVQQKVVIGAAHAVHVERGLSRRAARREGNRHGRLDGIGRQQRQVRIVAAVQRQLHHLSRVDNLPVLARIRLQRGRGSRDIHGFGYRAHLHGHLDALARVDIHQHVLGGVLRETGVLHDHRVAAHLHVEEVEIPLFIRRDFGLNAHLLVDERDAGARNQGARGVVNGAEDFGGIVLRPQCGGEQRRKERKLERQRGPVVHKLAV